MFSRKASMFAAAIVGAAISAPAMAATVTFFQFQGDPDLASSPKEFVYNSTTGLSAGPGAVGNGGNMSIFSPGLLGTITGGLPGVANSPPGLGLSAPYYVLSDLTLTLTGFAPVGNADTSVSGKISQNLGAGTFTITHPAFGGKALLAGTVTGALITEKKAGVTPGPGDNASILSGTVTYTDSVLEDSFFAAGLDTTGTFSFALTGITGSYSTTLVNGEYHLASFAGDGTGSFDANPLTGGGNPVPTPAAVWGGFGLVGLLGAARIKKHRDMTA